MNQYFCYNSDLLTPLINLLRSFWAPNYNFVAQYNTVVIVVLSVFLMASIASNREIQAALITFVLSSGGSLRTRYTFSMSLRTLPLSDSLSRWILNNGFKPKSSPNFRASNASFSAAVFLFLRHLKVCFIRSSSVSAFIWVCMSFAILWIILSFVLASRMFCLCKLFSDSPGCILLACPPRAYLDTNFLLQWGH